MQDHDQEHSRQRLQEAFFQSHHFSPIIGVESELLNLYDQEEDKQAVSLFLNWFRQLASYGKVAPVDYAQLDYVYRTKEEVRTMLVATLEQERKKIYQQGKAEGRMEAQQQTIRQLLPFRFELTETEQRKFAQQVVRIQDCNTWKS